MEWPDYNTLRNTHELKTESMNYSEEKLGGKLESIVIKSFRLRE